MKRAVDKILIAFAVHAATHVPSSIALDFASAKRDVVRIGINASACRSRVPGYGPAFHSESSMVLAAILQAVIYHAHAAALAIRSRSVARDLAAFHGEFGVTLNMHSAGRGAIPEFSTLVIRDLAAGHLERGSLIIVLAIHNHRATLVTGVALDVASAHIKACIAHQHNASGREVIAGAISRGNAIVSDNAALHDNLSAVCRVNNAAIHISQFATFDNTTRHGKRGIVSRQVDNARVHAGCSTMANNGIPGKRNQSAAGDNGALAVRTAERHLSGDFKRCAFGHIDQYGKAALYHQDGIRVIRRDLDFLPSGNLQRGAQLHMLFQRDDGLLAIRSRIDRFLERLRAIAAHGVAYAIVNGFTRICDLDA